MPVRDHFHGSERGDVGWEGFHTVWIANITARLNRGWLPADYYAAPERGFGAVTMDLGPACQPAVAYAEPFGEQSCPLAIPAPDAGVSGFRTPFARVLVKSSSGRLVGVTELVYPANKDCLANVDAFVGKMQNYLSSGVSLVLVDLVSFKSPNLHNRWADLFGDRDTPRIDTDGQEQLYAVAYRPYFKRLGSGGEARVDLWVRTTAVGDELSTIPLFICDDLAVPIDLDPTYQETCRDLRLATE